MGAKTDIAWTDATVNAWIGCTNISPGCDHCYAERMARRLGVRWGAGQERMQTKRWRDTLAALDRKAKRLGAPLRVFPNSMSDPFDNAVPDEWRADLFAAPEQFSNLQFQFLTKRIGNVARMVPAAWLNGEWPRNAWLGITVVNQEEADRDVHKLIRLPAPVTFLSCEPLLGPIDLRKACAQFRMYEHEAILSNLNWVIVGGESGHGARPFDIDLARSMVAQCRAAGVPVFVKQLGARVTCNGMSGPDEHWPVGGQPLREEMNPHGQPHGSFRKYLIDKKGGDWNEWPLDLRVREFPTTHTQRRQP